MDYNRTIIIEKLFSVFAAGPEMENAFLVAIPHDRQGPYSVKYVGFGNALRHAKEHKQDLDTIYFKSGTSEPLQVLDELLELQLYLTYK